MTSEKKQQSALDAVGRLLPAGTHVGAYGTGRANARMSPLVSYLIVGLLVAIVVVAVVTSRVYFPGVIVILLFFSVIKPVRGIAVLDGTVVVVSVKAMNGKPHALLGELPHAVLLPPHIRFVGKKSVAVPLGPDVVRLRVRDYERLCASLPAPDPRSSAPVGDRDAGWYPLDGDDHRQGYWNGSAWMAMKNWNGSAWVDAEPSRP